MYILHNAGKNISRNKGRNILMGIIILVIIATSAVALIINNTAGGIIDNYKERFSSEVSITPNMEKIQQEAMQNAQNDGGGQIMKIQRPEIPPEQYVLFGESEYLKEARYTSAVGVNSEDITPIDEEKGGGGGAMRISQGYSTDAAQVASDDGQFYANLLGYNSTPEDFANGNRRIADGRFPEADNECIISKDLLENSGLKIGDTITLTGTLRDATAMFGDEDIATANISYTLTIVGYYDDAADEYNNEYIQNAYTNRRNEILTTVETVISQMRDGFSGIMVNARYYLHNPEMINSFAAELYAKGLDDKFDVTTDEVSYNTIVKPVEGLKSITYVFLIVVLLLGAVILFLLSSISIRERKYEIGVLRAMGMKKHKVAFGLLSEIVMITVVCLAIGLVTGITVAQPVSDMLLENQISQIESENNNPGGAMGIQGGAIRTYSMSVRPGGAAPAEALKSMDVSLNISTTGQIILVSLLLAILASLAGIAHITKYEPIKILSDRT